MQNSTGVSCNHFVKKICLAMDDSNVDKFSNWNPNFSLEQKFVQINSQKLGGNF